MDKFIALHFKRLLRRLSNAEHFDFFNTLIINKLQTTAGTIVILNYMLNELRTEFGREDALYLQSRASVLTPDIAYLHEKRIALYSHFLHCLHITKYYENPDLTQAATKLLFLINNYKGLKRANYPDASGMMTNFLEDCEQSEWKASIEALSLTDTIDMAKAANDAFKSLYYERSMDKLHVFNMGKLYHVRRDVDNAFEALVETINAIWRENEAGAKDEGLRDKLTELRVNIRAAIHQAELTLAHRKHHKKEKKEEAAEKKDAASQTASAAAKPAAGGDKASS
ncbi:MAG: DUF6261 family protein [Tannerellaceae bacterium]|jgi:hypothetical protein|nr:DUF6261 family protein [Tannerellaceae bacterium]